MPVTMVSKQTSAGNQNDNDNHASKEQQLPERRVAGRDRQACLRCGKPVPKGTLIERVLLANGKATWVHAECGDSARGGGSTSTQAGTQQQHAGSTMTDEDMQELLAKLDAAAKQASQLVLESLDADLAKRDAEIDKLREQLQQLQAKQPPREVVIKVGSAKPVKLDEVVHPAFDRVCKLVRAGKPVFLPGPTGCGKTHLAEQVAKFLKLDFDMVSCSAGMSEGHLTGRLLPVGASGKFEYVMSRFIELYEKGGLFLVDEIDAADANVLLVINAALANGYCPVVNRPDKPRAKRHPKFACIAAANTFGRGADREYCGRNQLDEATLDRFRYGTVPMDYDPAIERELVVKKGAPVELYDMLARFRERIRAAKLRRPLSTRFMLDAADGMVLLGDTLQDVEDIFFQGWRADEIAKVKGE